MAGPGRTIPWPPAHAGSPNGPHGMSGRSTGLGRGAARTPRPHKGRGDRLAAITMDPAAETDSCTSAAVIGRGRNDRARPWAGVCHQVVGGSVDSGSVRQLGRSPIRACMERGHVHKLARCTCALRVSIRLITINVAQKYVVDVFARRRRAAGSRHRAGHDNRGAGECRQPEPLEESFPLPASTPPSSEPGSGDLTPVLPSLYVRFFRYRTKPS